MANFKFNDAAVEKLDKGVEAGLDDTADFIANRWKDNIQHVGAVDRSDYLASVKVFRTAPFERVISTDRKYAPTIEFGAGPAIGRPPFRVPHDRIEEWMVRKLGTGADEADKAAWAIQKKIEKEGFEPRPCARPAAIEGKAKMMYFITRAIKKEFMR